MPTAFLPRGKAITLNLKDEATFGVMPAGNFTTTHIYSHTLEQSEGFDEDPLLGRARTNNRDSEVPGPDLAQVTGDIVAPLDYNHIGVWLKGAFGAASVVGAGDPYTHTFTSGSEVLPHRSIEVGLGGGSSIFMQYLGILANTLGFDCGRAAGFDRVTIGCMGKQEQKAGATGAGAPSAAWAVAQAPKALPIFKLSGTQVGYVAGVKATYDNGASILDYMGTKYPSGHVLDKMATWSGTVDIRFPDATLYDMAVANAAAVSTEILWSTSASRSLSLLCANTRLERSGVKIDGPGGIKQSFKFRGEQTAGAAMLVATLKSLVPVY